MQIVFNNFLRWFDGNPDTGIPKTLPHAYWLDRSRCAYAPVAVDGEVLSFYLNTDAGEDITNFPDLRLSLHCASDGALIGGNVAPLQKVFIDSPTDHYYHIYADVTLPAAAPGLYYFKIYRSSTGAEQLRSSYIRYRTDLVDIYNTTTYVKFKHDRFFYNTRYHLIPSFYQQFRLDLSVLETQVESDKETYVEVTTGKPRTFQNYLQKFHKVETYHFDPEAHLAAAIMAEHDTLIMNTKRYRWKSSYKEITNVRTKSTKGEFEVYDEEFSSANRC